MDQTAQGVDSPSLTSVGLTIVLYIVQCLPTDIFTSTLSRGGGSPGHLSMMVGKDRTHPPAYLGMSIYLLVSHKTFILRSSTEYFNTTYLVQYIMSHIIRNCFILIVNQNGSYILVQSGTLYVQEKYGSLLYHPRPFCPYPIIRLLA